MAQERYKGKERPVNRPSLDGASEHYVLRLYVTGVTLRSTRAIKNIKRICDSHLAGRYELEVIDVYQQPELARTHQIVAAPTLIKELPHPLRRFVGDLSRTEHILIGLNLVPNHSWDKNES